MLVGTAGTGCLLEGFDIIAVDLNERMRLIRLNKRGTFTFPDYIDLIDFSYLEVALELETLSILIGWVSELGDIHRDGVHELWTTVGTKRQVKPRKTQIFPLASNAYKETTLGDMNKSIRDMLAKLGQKDDSYKQRVWFAGGDGLSFERLVQLANTMQFQDSEYQIYEAHWDSEKSRDPSSIGWAANLLKRKGPADLKKVHFYKYRDLMYIVLRAHILDCWRVRLNVKTDLRSHFASLKQQQKLPELAELHQHARAITLQYASPASFHWALGGTPESATTPPIPQGAPWSPIQDDPSSLNLRSAMECPTGNKKVKKAKGVEPPAEPFTGDETLARSTRLIHDALTLRIADKAVKRGDVGALYGVMKSMALTFAGSSHKKYSNYVLEFVCSLELEASPAMKDLVLENYLVNASGFPGHYESGDQFQEQLQDEFYEHVGDTDAGFDDSHIAEVIAPNTFNFLRCKKTLQQSLGLAQRAGKHDEPLADADIRQLLRAFESQQPHNPRPGRSYSKPGKGSASLANGKFDSWAQSTSRVRHLGKEATTSGPGDEVSGLDDNDSGGDVSDTAEEEGSIGDSGDEDDVDSLRNLPDEDEGPSQIDTDESIITDDTILGQEDDNEWSKYATENPDY
ncbi:hypothetical protein V5O48_017176 [Marasmius crinis-equi]|uniref:DUF6589 domain-containing protein n=1 Tax=Marasmius crinis-equi TaxID=585013 RepID=A0ABR3EPQ7_9AGAR